MRNVVRQLTGLALACALAQASCTKKEQPAPEQQAVASARPAAGAAAAGAPEGRVDIVAWPGYIERGESEKPYDWVTPFERDTGCKVNVKTAGTSDEMVALMNQGGYDLVTASGDASLRLVAGKKVQPVDLSKVPSYASVDPRLQNAPWHTVEGKHYGVPYQWGPNVLAYRTDVFKTPPDSWSVVFEEQKLPDGKPNKGRVQAYDGPIALADAALYLMSKKPELGIKDPYELTEAQYNAALDLARKQRGLVHRYWHDANVQVQDFTNEGVVASSTWPFQINTLKGNKQPVASVIPKEGATGWADTTMLAADAKHPACAYKWLEWSLNPKVQGDVAAWFGSVPAVTKGCEASELLGKEGCQKHGAGEFERIKFWKTPTAQCASQGDKCVPYSRWSTDYVAVMGKR
jgi:putative spermidine/putrescine transport system substrate-binding protein